MTWYNMSDLFSLGSFFTQWLQFLSLTTTNSSFNCGKLQDIMIWIIILFWNTDFFWNQSAFLRMQNIALKWTVKSTVSLIVACWYAKLEIILHGESDKFTFSDLLKYSHFRGKNNCWIWSLNGGLIYQLYKISKMRRSLATSLIVFLLCSLCQNQLITIFSSALLDIRG